MLSIYSVFKCRFTRPPWNNKVPVREELFSIERLEQHAKSEEFKLADGEPDRDIEPLNQLFAQILNAQ